jgi:glyoxylase-like metal-dependent hydrolase (beta-lactamase superfamily II)
MAEKTSPSGEWSIREFADRVDRGETPFVFDVRNRDESEAFPLEGRAPLPTLSVPYFEILDRGGKDDLVDSAVAFTKNELASHLPRDRKILAVCAKGETSAHVGLALRRLGYDAVSLHGGMRAWGHHYTARPVVAETEALAVYQIARPARGCLSYVVASRGRAVVIDALRDVEFVLALAREKHFAIERVIDTHAHADHVSGGPALAAKTGAAYSLHPYDGIHPIDALPATIEFEWLRGGDRFQVGDVSLEALHVPGHTLGMVALRLDDRFLFAGDTVFLESISRPDLGGHAEPWAALHYRSIRKLLMELPGETLVLPGHFGSLREAGPNGLFAAPLARLARKNEGLLMAARDEAEFVRYILRSLPDFPPQYADMKRVNAGLLAADEEKIDELELGKNRCALESKRKSETTPPS